MAVLTAGRKDTKINRLARHRLLAGCNPAETARVARVFDEVDIRAGGVVLEAGPLARWFLLIDTGDAGGDYCGAEALLLHSPQRTTVTARTDVRAFVAGGRELLGVVNEIPALARGPLGALVKSLPAPTRPQPRRSFAPPRPATPFRADRGVAETSRPAQKVPAWFWAIVIGALVALVVGAQQYHPPVVLLSPGRAIDISGDVTITGAPVYPVHGHYLMTPVRLRRPSLLALGVNTLTHGAEVIALGGGVDHRALREAGRATFDESRLRAAAAAARATGLQVAFSPRFRDRDIIGPSAGLVYALLIADLLQPGDQAGGRSVAATGTIDASGRVGDVGSLQEKLVGARRGGAALMLLPADQLGEAGSARITVIGVASLDDALAALAG